MKNKIILFFLSSFIFGEIDYQTQIQPIFDNNCSGYCHVNGGSYQGNLDLSSYGDLMSGNSNHGPVITPGDAINSVLIQKIMGTSDFGSRMPQGNSTYFDEHEEELQLIIDWINEGANEIPLEISNKITQLPAKIKLFENYPNPFNPSTTLVWNQNQLDNWTMLFLWLRLSKWVPTRKIK